MYFSSFHYNITAVKFPLSRIEYIIKETILLVNVTFVGYNPCVISTRSSPFILIDKEMLSFKMWFD